jgi:hypothetical protein
LDKAKEKIMKSIKDSVVAGVAYRGGTVRKIELSKKSVAHLNFDLVETTPGPPQQPPGPDFPTSPVVPVFLRDFVFAQEAGFEGSLQNVVASFVAD